MALVVSNGGTPPVIRRSGYEKEVKDDSKPSQVAQQTLTNASDQPTMRSSTFNYKQIGPHIPFLADRSVIVSIENLSGISPAEKERRLALRTKWMDAFKERYTPSCNKENRYVHGLLEGEQPLHWGEWGIYSRLKDIQAHTGQPEKYVFRFSTPGHRSFHEVKGKGETLYLFSEAQIEQYILNNPPPQPEPIKPFIPVTTTTTQATHIWEENTCVDKCFQGFAFTVIGVMVVGIAILALGPEYWRKWC